MKKFIFAVFLIPSLIAFAQNPLNKISTRLNTEIESKKSGDKILVWIYFRDKGNNLKFYFNNPESALSKKSLDRREKRLKKKSSSLDFTDVPLNQEYLKQLSSNGFTLKQKSKWLNAVSGYVDELQLQTISKYDFIKKIDLVNRFQRARSRDELKISPNDSNASLQKSESTHSINYGPSYSQLELSKIPEVHDLGYSGQGITICVLDAGFDNLGHEVFQNMNIIAKWDFVNGDSIVANQNDMGEGSHGTATLSLIGGFKEWQLVGPAYASNFILAKTENTDSETPIEEDNWIAALEWADSIGVDVTSTSLGYLEFDSPYTSLTWQDMDGNTAPITIVADLAVKKGIVVVNSAGNEGYNADHNTLNAPADGDSVIAVGAVNSVGIRALFSSVGPTIDGRIKPDVMAMGSNDYIATSVGNSYNYGSGTSFNCPLVAGVFALLLEAKPSLTPMDIMQTLKSTASLSNNPNNLYGWGIVNALSAINNVISDVADKNMPKDFYLLSNYPNPFNPTTVIRFSIPKKSFVKILLYDLLGREIKTLASSEFESGTKEILLDGSDLSSGNYFVRLISEGVQKTLKISLIK